MDVNDTTDREVAVLRALLQQYRPQCTIDDEQHGRSKVEHLYRPYEDFAAFDIAPLIGGYPVWDDHAVAWCKVLGKSAQVRFDIHDDLRIFRHGDVACMSFSLAGCGESAGGDKFHNEMPPTLVWLHDGEGASWQITHEHGSRPRTTQLTGGEVV